MTECFACLQDMLDAEGCVSDRKIIINDTVHDPIRYGDENRLPYDDGEPSSPCHDCGAHPGEIHHSGCDMEECPNCGGQYFVCDCYTEEKEEIWGGVDA